MTRATFGDLRRDLDEACEFVRFFALGHRGFTRRDVVAGISRVRELCDRMLYGFGSGEHRKETATALVAAKEHIQSAQDRLDLLEK
jgi:hypothetical protein